MSAKLNLPFLTPEVFLLPARLKAEVDPAVLLDVILDSTLFGCVGLRDFRAYPNPKIYINFSHFFLFEHFIRIMTHLKQGDNMNRERERD